MEKLSAFTIIILAFSLSACATDPAVRLANCVKHASSKLKHSDEQSLKTSCDLSVQGNYSVVLYPNIILNDSALGSVGMDIDTIATVRSLRFPAYADIEPFESMYVLPKNKRDLPSRTTYYGNFASIPKLLFIEKSNPEVIFTIETTGDSIEIINIE